MMKDTTAYSAEYFVKTLALEPHQEGGFFRRVQASGESVQCSRQNGDKERPLWTSIYFLLRDGEVSHLHRLKSDEMWYFHAGSALTIYMITPEGELITEELGLNAEAGEKPQVLVPRGYIFGSAMNRPGFSLVGCMVAPGFDYEDFELFEREALLRRYPQYEDVIQKLTYECLE